MSTPVARAQGSAEKVGQLQSFRIESQVLTYFQSQTTNIDLSKFGGMTSMASMDSNLLKYELALNRLGTSASPKKRPIVERGKSVFSQQDAVFAAAQALAALWKKPRSGGGSW
jgi:hypothetical protein